MKQRSSYILIIWLCGILLLNGLLFVLLTSPAMAQGADSVKEPACKITNEDFESVNGADIKPIKVQIKLPGVTYDFDLDKKGGNEHYVKSMSCYLVGFYTYFAGVAGILATVMMMFGGIKYVISMGNPQKMSDAKDTITSAVMGLVITLGSYVLLNFINPNLTTLKITGIDTITPIEQEEPFDWEGINFCKEQNKSTIPGHLCGFTFHENEQDQCYGVGQFTAKEGSICIAKIVDNKPTVKSVGEIELTYNNKKIDFLGDRNVDCGAIYYHDNPIPLLPDPRGIGTKCPDEKTGCVIFYDKGSSLYGQSGFRRGAHEYEIGTFQDYNCY